ncbi:NAD(P)-dependent oxidoreductase [Mucilaginibacter rubeus]|uniref:NAD(P)H-binding protein n=1 Tax=Mucilaginibacter rubeus TaxID=2027860 RepID=A0A5C1I6V3_9SPHI|nr:NAD(P)H-binding protein [Mucilaginibacter rubeus]QEM13613.1 NAD(P)H-binding protein [Mucilaginibacter rubeus]
MAILLILGGTGRTGAHLLRLALAEGHIVHALVRDCSKVKSSSSALYLFEGLPTNAERLKEAAFGCEAIISTLNISRTSDWPWAKLRTPVDLLSETIKHIISFGEEAPRRIIVTSAWGVNESRQEIPGWFRWLIDRSNIGPAYTDHGLQENLLADSRLEWTAVRPVGLVNLNRNKPVKVSLSGKPKPRLTISREAVARFLLYQVTDTRYIKACPVIYQ